MSVRPSSASEAFTPPIVSRADGLLGILMLPATTGGANWQGGSLDPETGLLLGAHILGPDAANLIQPLIQAMSFGLAGQDMARGQYWIHPALPEVIENALLALCGEPPWPPSRRH